MVRPNRCSCLIVVELSSWFIGGIETEEAGEWIAVVSGLDIGSASPADAQIQMLVEYLTGEGGAMDDQVSSSQISRLIIAGDSLSSTANSTEPASPSEERKTVRKQTLPLPACYDLG